MAQARQANRGAGVGIHGRKHGFWSLVPKEVAPEAEPRGNSKAAKSDGPGQAASPAASDGLLPHNGSSDGNPAGVTPRVFLSYSHDSEAHKAWVRLLAERLLEGGVEVTLDQWELPLGADVVRFMDLGIRDADRVLMVCTANYVAKAEERKGGAGYECIIVTGHVARATDTIKFVPIVRGNSGQSLVPAFLGQRLWLDFRDDGLFEERLEELLRELHGAPRYRKPPLGTTRPARSVLQPVPERRHVFISYSHADRAWVERLKRMMAPLLRGSGQELRLWDDSRIEPGMRWRQEIETALAEAKVALLLVSDNFLASEFVMGQEVPKLLAATEAEGVTVLWVSLSPSFVEETEIQHYQAVLPPHRHLEAMAEVEVKEALKTIGVAIRNALKAAPVKAMPAEPTAGPPPTPDPDPPPAAGPAQVARGGLPTETIELETARLLRQGTGWQVKRQPLRVERALLPLPEGNSLPLLLIPGGEFVMGSPPDELERQECEGPQHRVRLGGFWMGQAPVTQAQWRALAQLVPPLGQRWQRQLPANPSSLQPEGEVSTDQRPVERVSWHDAMEFCRRLDTVLPVGSGLLCTLPSEAQWEFACRAGTTMPFAFGDTITPQLANYGKATYANGPEGESRLQTTPVGMFPANAWGLQDMHGNVEEWCLDHWHDIYGDAPFDGRAWIDPDAQDLKAELERPRLLRGGFWNAYPSHCRSAYRNADYANSTKTNIGFRVVCLPQGPSINT